MDLNMFKDLFEKKKCSNSEFLGYLIWFQETKHLKNVETFLKSTKMITFSWILKCYPQNGMNNEVFVCSKIAWEKAYIYGKRKQVWLF